ncbi:MAG: hypothetical protein ACKO5E_09580 [bacterium]
MSIRQCFSLILSATFFIFPATNASSQEKNAKKADYYPLKVGTQWYYKGEANGTPLQLRNEVTKIENINGVEMGRIETFAQERSVANEHISSNAKGVFRNRIQGVEPDPAVMILQFPVKPGDKWTVDSKVSGETIKGVYKTEEEEVTVPAGKYKAIKVVSDAEVIPSGQKVLSTVWMVDGVGIVKQITDLGQVQVKLELEKFVAGK